MTIVSNDAPGEEHVMIDYKTLLVRYIKLVEEQGGVNYVDCAAHPDFTEDELMALKAASEESLKMVSIRNEVLESDVPVIVDFWAPWCGPCKAAGPLIDEIAQANEGRVKIVKVNVDESTDFTVETGVRTIPTLIAFKGGVEVERSGFKGKTALQEMVERLCAAPE